MDQLREKGALSTAQLLAASQSVPTAASEPPGARGSGQRLEWEATRLNDALADLRADFNASAATMAAIKSTVMVNVPEPTIRAHFQSLATSLHLALNLGAFEGAYVDQGARQAYADSVKEQLHGYLKRQPQRPGETSQGDQADSLAKVRVGWEHCLRWAGACGFDRPLYKTDAKGLARTISAKLGTGALAGVFPGETAEVSPADLPASRRSAPRGQRNAERPELLAARQEAMLGVGRSLAAELARIPQVQAEVTGSLVLAQGGYAGVPDDVDVNMTVRFEEGVSEEKQRSERVRAWHEARGVLDQVGGVGITTAGSTGKIQIRPLTPWKLDANENRAERRWGFEVPEGPHAGKLIAFWVEVKDVTGDVWRDHLAADADAREAGPGLTTQPAWLLLDCIKRVIAFKADAEEQARVEPEVLVQLSRSLLEEADKKRLREKIAVAAKMTAAVGVNVRSWIDKEVEQSRRDAFHDALAAAGNDEGFKTWLVAGLTEVHPD